MIDDEFGPQAPDCAGHRIAVIVVGVLGRQHPHVVVKHHHRVGVGVESGLHALGHDCNPVLQDRAGAGREGRVDQPERKPAVDGHQRALVGRESRPRQRLPLGQSGGGQCRLGEHLSEFREALLLPAQRLGAVLDVVQRPAQQVGRRDVILQWIFQPRDDQRERPRHPVHGDREIGPLQWLEVVDVQPRRRRVGGHVRRPPVGTDPAAEFRMAAPFRNGKDAWDLIYACARACHGPLCLDPDPAGHPQPASGGRTQLDLRRFGVDDGVELA